jgi:hypothetical protein
METKNPFIDGLPLHVQRFIKKATSVIGLVTILTFISGCRNIKPGGTRSGKSLYEVFYVGEQGDQYFIKPLKFYHDPSKQELVVDFTFRYHKQVKDSVTVNFSVLGDSIYKNCNALEISSGDELYSTNQVQLLFNDKKSKKFVSRFTTKIPLIKIKRLFNSSDWEIQFTPRVEKQPFTANRKTTKSITRLNSSIFILM